MTLVAVVPVDGLLHLFQIRCAIVKKRYSDGILIRFRIDDDFTRVLVAHAMQDGVFNQRLQRESGNFTGVELRRDVLRVLESEAETHAHDLDISSKHL